MSKAGKQLVEDHLHHQVKLIKHPPKKAKHPPKKKSHAADLGSALKGAY